jgi:DNA invertase Pin-like site-specific DNA recombinase
MKAAYLRVSSDAQTAIRQRETLNHLPIDQWYEDSEGCNPRDKADRRPEFQRLLRDVERGLVDTVYVAAQDRFGTKDAYEMGAFFDLLRRHKCKLLDAAGKHLNATDDATILTSTIGALTSSREQTERGKRVVTGKIPRARRGEYQGGHVPFAFDVVCFRDGVERWRLVIEGRNRRLKVFPDGSSERFDGKRNHPAKELHDVLKLRPSNDPDKIAMARKVFAWAAAESITDGQLATRLNDLGVPCAYAPMWHRAHVAYLLTNPIYLGLPTWNKASNGRFARHDGPVAPDAPEFPPIIDEQTWCVVQEKRENRPKKPRSAPRTAALWLRGFVVCGNCGKPMRAKCGSKDNCQPPGYICSTYARWGAKNPTGCRHCVVPHELLESMILNYFSIVAPKLKELLDATTAKDLEAARPLMAALAETETRYGWAWLDLSAVVDENLDEQQMLQHFRAGGTTESAYALLHERIRPALEKSIAEKEAELEALLDGFAGLSPLLKERANRRGEALQEEITALRRELVDLRGPLDAWRRELETRRAALDKAQSSLTMEGQFRQKADALRPVIERIVCQFNSDGRCRLQMVQVNPGAPLPQQAPGAPLPAVAPGSPLPRYVRLGGLAALRANNNPLDRIPGATVLVTPLCGRLTGRRGNCLRPPHAESRPCWSGCRWTGAGSRTWPGCP